MSNELSYEEQYPLWERMAAKALFLSLGLITGFGIAFALAFSVASVAGVL